MDKHTEVALEKVEAEHMRREWKRPEVIVSSVEETESGFNTGVDYGFS